MKATKYIQRIAKKTTWFLFFFGIVFLLNQQAFAQDEKVLEKIVQLGLPNSEIYQIIFTLLQWLLQIFTLLAVMGFIISGIIFITAGASGRADSARAWLVNTIIGVIVGLSGYIVINFIDKILKGEVQSYF